MKEFFKNIETETLWGGIFGFVAIFAIIIEMFITGITEETVISAIKDIAGTLVSVMLFIFAIKHLLVQIKFNKTFEEKLKESLLKWKNDHATLVVRKERYDFEKENATEPTCFSFGLKTNLSDFYKNKESNNTGLFVRMPLLKKENYEKGNITLNFQLNKGTFFEGVEMSKEELDSAFNSLNNLFTEFINDVYANSGFAKAKGKGKDITVTICKPIHTQQDIDNFVSVINSMFNAYLVAANFNIK